MGFDDIKYDNGLNYDNDLPQSCNPLDNSYCCDLKISKSAKKQIEQTKPEIDGLKVTMGAPPDGNSNILYEVPLDEFAKVFKETKTAFAKSPHGKDAWRVSDVTIDEFKEYHPDAHCYLTPNNSTVAITKDGDIISVCKHPDDTDIRGKDIIRMAIEKGGCKLDSYDGNHKFYTKCGFEPISWCHWNDEYTPSDWKPGINEKEDVIFYRYNPEAEPISINDFKASTSASVNYDAALAERNNQMKNNK